MLPCCFSPEQMADGWEGENNCGHGWQTPLVWAPLNRPMGTRTVVYVCLDPLRRALMPTVCVIVASWWGSSLLLRLPGPQRQKTSPLSSQLVWWQQPSSEWSFHHLSVFTRCGPRGHADSKVSSSSCACLHKAWCPCLFLLAGRP